MSEPIQIIIGLGFLVLIFLFTRYVIVWKMKRATDHIIRDLVSKDATDIYTAVDLPYCKPNPMRVGMRNYHVKALEYLLAEGVVATTGSGLYYLKARPPAATG